MYATSAGVQPYWMEPLSHVQRGRSDLADVSGHQQQEDYVVTRGRRRDVGRTQPRQKNYGSSPPSVSQLQRHPTNVGASVHGAGSAADARTRHVRRHRRKRRARRARETPPCSIHLAFTRGGWQQPRVSQSNAPPTLFGHPLTQRSLILDEAPRAVDTTARATLHHAPHHFGIQPAEFFAWQQWQQQQPPQEERLPFPTLSAATSARSATATGALQSDRAHTATIAAKDSLALDSNAPEPTSAGLDAMARNSIASQSHLVSSLLNQAHRLSLDEAPGCGVEPSSDSNVEPIPVSNSEVSRNKDTATVETLPPTVSSGGDAIEAATTHDNPVSHSDTSSAIRAPEPVPTPALARESDKAHTTPSTSHNPGAAATAVTLLSATRSLAERGRSDSMEAVVRRARRRFTIAGSRFQRSHVDDLLQRAIPSRTPLTLLTQRMSARLKALARGARARRFLSAAGKLEQRVGAFPCRDCCASSVWCFTCLICRVYPLLPSVCGGAVAAHPQRDRVERAELLLCHPRLRDAIR